MSERRIDSKTLNRQLLTVAHRILRFSELVEVTSTSPTSLQCTQQLGGRVLSVCAEVNYYLLGRNVGRLIPPPDVGRVIRAKFVNKGPNSYSVTADSFYRRLSPNDKNHYTASILKDFEAYCDYLISPQSVTEGIAEYSQ